MHATLRRCFSQQAILRKNLDLHNDIASFLKYAKGSLLSEDTTVYVGTLYEYTVLQALKSCGIILKRVGGPGDRGMDLLGNWTIPNLPSEASQTPRSYNTVVSCKVSKLSPAFIRELDGAVTSYGPNTIGILANPHTCSRGIQEHLLSARRPLAFCAVKPYDEGGYLEQFVWNSAASDLLPKVGIKTRHVTTGEATGSRVVLTVDGHELGSSALSLKPERKRKRKP